MSPMFGHAGAPLAPHDLLRAWSFDPVIVGVVLLAGALYVRSVRRWWNELGRGAVVTVRQTVAFAGSLLAVTLALVSPLEALSAALFGAHMVQHLLLTLVAAPLLLLGRAHVALAPVLPLRVRRWGGRVVARALRRTGPAALALAVALHVVTVLAWHAPALYDLAAEVTWIHVTEHATLLATAIPFWAAMGATRPRPVAAAALGAFVASVVFVLLAATLTSASEPWYEAHLTTTAGFGLTPLQDQQLAAAIMWVPGGLVYLAAAAAAIVRWLRADERTVALQRRSART